jgi:hypothetical protein
LRAAQLLPVAIQPLRIRLVSRSPSQNCWMPAVRLAKGWAMVIPATPVRLQ